MPAHADRCTTIPVRVEGGSMSPRIAPGAMIQVIKGGPECLEPLKHGEVVLFESPSSRIPLIKALRGLPGEPLAVNDGKIIVGGKVARNSAGQPYQLSPARAAMIELSAHDYGKLPPDTFLVMGENPAGSTDSSRFGLIERRQIIGKMVENAR
jgi:signal peptidase I